MSLKVSVLRVSVRFLYKVCKINVNVKLPKYIYFHQQQWTISVKLSLNWTHFVLKLKYFWERIQYVLTLPRIYWIIQYFWRYRESLVFEILLCIQRLKHLSYTFRRMFSRVKIGIVTEFSSLWWQNKIKYIGRRIKYFNSCCLLNCFYFVYAQYVRFHFMIVWFLIIFTDFRYIPVNRYCLSKIFLIQYSFSNIFRV